MAIITHNESTKQQSTSTSVSREQLGLAPAEMQQTLKLAGLLQTTLEINNILEYFIDAAHARIEFDGVDYKFDELDTEIKLGSRKRHTCSYRLRLAGEFLGELTFSRKHRFAQQEMEQLENMLCQLIYPLRNAVWYQRAVRAAQLDPLTGVNNRTALATTLKREVELAHRNKTPVSLVVADIDHFKRVNDECGHSVGDEVLKTFTDVISRNLRSSDIVFRYGGEEFVMLLTGTDREGAFFVAERIRKAVEETVFNCNGKRVPLTCSFGTASLSSQDNSDSLFEKADTALYQAKDAGRNQVFCYTPAPQQQRQKA